MTADESSTSGPQVEPGDQEDVLPAAELPPGFAEWTSVGDLVLETARCEVGRVEIFPPARLGATRYRLTDEGTGYEIRAVELVHRAERLYPACLLWLPVTRRFGAIDFDHGAAVITNEDEWGAVVANPERFVDMLWRDDSVPFADLEIPEVVPVADAGDFEIIHPACQLDWGTKFGLAPAGVEVTHFGLNQCDRPAGVADRSAIPFRLRFKLDERERAVTSWKSPTLPMRFGAPTDFLASGGLNLCSERLRSVLAGARLVGTKIKWLPCAVVDLRGDVHPYWILHAYGTDDEWAGELLRPTSSISVVVTAALAARIAASGCTGVGFTAKRWG